MPRNAATGPKSGPFRTSPTARYRWAYEQLQRRAGRHLDLGIGNGTFLGAIHNGTSLQVIGADPHPDYLAAARRKLPEIPLVRVQDRLPFASASFDSASLLDVLEHTADERATLAEIHRVLRPGGCCSSPCPDSMPSRSWIRIDAKFRFPRLHRAVYAARFGSDVYRRRFVDASDGLHEDMAWTRDRHTNYRAADVLSMLEGAGFVPQLREGRTCSGASSRSRHCWRRTGHNMCSIGHCARTAGCSIAPTCSSPLSATSGDRDRRPTSTAARFIYIGPDRLAPRGFTRSCVATRRFSLRAVFLCSRFFDRGLFWYLHPVLRCASSILCLARSVRTFSFIPTRRSGWRGCWVWFA